MNYIKVKNVTGSSRYSAPSGYNSWLDYWEKQSGRKISKCTICGCINKNLVGAHVQKVNSVDKKWYIVPLCNPCNQRNDVFEVLAEYLIPVPSNL